VFCNADCCPAAGLSAPQHAKTHNANTNGVELKILPAKLQHFAWAEAQAPLKKQASCAAEHAV